MSEETYRKAMAILAKLRAAINEAGDTIERNNREKAQAARTTE